MSSSMQPTDDVAAEAASWSGRELLVWVASLPERLSFDYDEVRSRLRDWLHQVGIWYLGSVLAHLLALLVVGLVLGTVHMATRPINFEAPSFDTTLDTVVVPDMSLPVEL